MDIFGKEIINILKNYRLLLFLALISYIIFVMYLFSDWVRKTVDMYFLQFPFLVKIFNNEIMIILQFAFFISMLIFLAEEIYHKRKTKPVDIEGKDQVTHILKMRKKAFINAFISVVITSILGVINIARNLDFDNVKSNVDSLFSFQVISFLILIITFVAWFVKYKMLRQEQLELKKESKDEEA